MLLSLSQPKRRDKVNVVDVIHACAQANGNLLTSSDGGRNMVLEYDTKGNLSVVSSSYGQFSDQFFLTYE